ncbi:MAG: hypothetical protein U0527_14255 [Candidatus Eisenbacteria bacterium]
MNKPSGIVTTRSDEQRTTVDDRRAARRTGRADRPLGSKHRRAAPLHESWRAGPSAAPDPRFGSHDLFAGRAGPSPLALKEVERGIAIGRGALRSGRGEAVELPGRGRLVRITLREGKNREVRRIFRALGSKVLNLRRIAYAGIELADLPVGSIRALTPAEVRYLGERTALAL